MSTKYVQRIEEVADSSDPSALLAHSYVRYLGDLSGGQTIRHTLAKAYELDEAAGLGVSFYAFKELRSSKPASQGEMKRIKDWFREGMNKAGDQGVEVKVAVLEEAKSAFILNSELLTILDLDDAEESPKEELEITQETAQEKTYPYLKGYQKLLAFEQWFGNLFQLTKTD
ncbi:hypothetical protein BDZ97DRAFT_1816531 [Flammula alnicola]|nr:hypothetical protein BDZ97DRAFT_1816531 [Flammula alnicola]